MPAGTPRGFNLQQFGLAGMTPMQNFGQPGGFAPFFAGAGQIHLYGATMATAAPVQSDVVVDNTRTTLVLDLMTVDRVIPDLIKTLVV